MSLERVHRVATLEVAVPVMGGMTRVVLRCWLLCRGEFTYIIVRGADSLTEISDTNNYV